MEDFDLIIVGAGVAGASLAWRLAGTRRVAVLEMEPQPGYHASGRSATHLNLTVGVPAVRRLSAVSRTFFLQPPEDFAGGPLVTPCPALTVAAEDERALAAECLRELHELGSDARELDAAELRTMVPILSIRPGRLAVGVFDPEGYRIDGHALLGGYLRGLRRAGGELLTDAAVTSLRHAGGHWHIEAGGRTLRAPVVVNAAGAWADEVARHAGVRTLGLTPLRRTAVTFNLPDGIDARQWPFVKCVSERWYFVPEAGGLLLSPADETPMPPCDVQPDEYDVAVAVDRFEAVTDITVERLTARWAGLRTFAADRLPVVGHDPAAPGFFWLAGQGGAGLQTSPALSALAAAVLDGREPDPELHAAGLDATLFAPARLADASP